MTTKAIRQLQNKQPEKVMDSEFFKELTRRGRSLISMSMLDKALKKKVWDVNETEDKGSLRPENPKDFKIECKLEVIDIHCSSCKSKKFTLEDVKQSMSCSNPKC